MSSVEEDRDMPGPDVPGPDVSGPDGSGPDGSGPDVPGLDVATDPGLLLLEQYRAWAAERLDNDVLIEEHPCDPISEANEHLRLAVEALADADVGSMQGDGLLATVLAVDDTRRRLDALNALVLADVEMTGAAEIRAGLTAKQWIVHRTHGDPLVVARELRVARTLIRFEGFAEALAAGEIRAEHVLALAKVCNSRTADALLEAEHRLLRVAKFQTYRHYVDFLRRVAAMVDPDGPEPDCGDRDSASVDRDLEGHLHVRLEASGHNAVEIEGIIQAETDRQYRAATRDHKAAGIEVPPLRVLRARAIVELIRRGTQANPRSSQPAVEAVLPITVDRDGNPTAVRPPGGYSLEPIAAATLLCDANFQAVMVDSAGMPINLGRSVRWFTPAQRKAMVLRDGGCIFPGCDQPAERCDGHHEYPWEQGGPTDVDSGSMLCRRHHGLVHCHDPWVIEHFHIDDLPPHLLEAHRIRAAAANLDPASDVRVFRSPSGDRYLAQNAADHHGPTPPRRPPAA